MNTFFSLVILLLLFFSCTENKISGTVSDTDTGRVATIYNTDHTPAPGATIKIFEVNDTTKTPRLQLITDQSGKYSLKGLSNGVYNVFAEKDSLVAFQDSIQILTDTALIKDDTLETPVSLKGIVGLQPNHDPRSVTVQVVGTDIYSNVDESGNITLNKIASGKFTLKLATTLKDYTTTYKKVNVNVNTPDSLTDTLWLIYTGIPVIESISGTYDTLNGVVKLSWITTKYRDFQDYLIYRDYSDSLKLSTSPIAVTADSFYCDTIFNKNLQSGRFSFLDSNDYRFKYRVKIRNNSLDEGQSYKYFNIVAASPLKVSTTISYQSYHMTKGFFTDTASINDSIRFIFAYSNPNRSMININYTDSTTTSILSSKAIDTVKAFMDTLVLKWNSIGKKTIFIDTKDAAGFYWKKTVSFWIVEDKPFARFDTSQIVFNTPSKIKAATFDKYGTITKCELKIEDGEFVSTSIDSPETSILLDSLQSALKCFIRLTDDDNITTIDSIELAVKIDCESIQVPTDISLGFVFALSDKIIATDNTKKTLWQTSDLINWHIINNNVPWITQQNKILRSAICNDEMWILTIPPQKDSTLILWHSTDGVLWDTLVLPQEIINTNSSFFYTYVFLSSYKDSLVIGYTGEFESDKGKGTVWLSANGVDWIQKKAPDQPGVELPVIQFSQSYTSYEYNGYLYTITYKGDFNKVGNYEIWSIDSWKTITLVTTLSYLGYNNHIFDYANKLCFITTTSDTKDPSINYNKLYTIDNQGAHFISILPGSKNFNIGSVFNFKGKTYFSQQNGIYQFK
jgi:hypothetical protein